MIKVPCQLTSTKSNLELGSLYDGPRPTSITLLQRIYGGPRRWSQVYRAKVGDWDRPVLDLQPPESFVLKLYVVSEVSSLEDWDPDGLDHLGPEAEKKQRTMAERETQAYSRLTGCPVTPRWYGTYQFTLPSGEVSEGTLLEYLDGKQISREYILDENGGTLPFAERMITAAEALDQVHSRLVLHGDIREANILILNDTHDPFPIRFVDFGFSRPIERLRKKAVRIHFRAETERWMVLLLKYFGLRVEESYPEFRAIPREGVIMKFIETWDIRPTYEEQIEAMVAMMMAQGNLNEVVIRKIAIETIR
ncbi:hypothetical protein BDV93DRAFT_547393 [Ceratobasidium sp. AG-I]|nr:hypothetical protein BDV93DRAFT_547393 [Ceratobasidium sp. AG-I]